VLSCLWLYSLEYKPTLRYTLHCRYVDEEMILFACSLLAAGRCHYRMNWYMYSHSDVWRQWAQGLILIKGLFYADAIMKFLVCVLVVYLIIGLIVSSWYMRIWKLGNVGNFIHEPHSVVAVANTWSLKLLDHIFINTESKYKICKPLLSRYWDSRILQQLLSKLRHRLYVT